jgi:putative CocE/NonD family hydrolase
VLKPFLDRYLKSGAAATDIPPVVMFETGTLRWRHYDRWPLACAEGCRHPMKPLFLRPGLGLSFERAETGAPFEEYVSDPARPVPYVRRPIRSDDPDQWRYWLTTDQRHVDGRPDVLTFASAPLTEPITVAGEPRVDLFASTSGTDSDWVVKLIDVYPDVVPSDVEMGGYELGVAMDIFRGRYRNGFASPSAIPANEVQRYRFDLPPSNHVFLKGHRIMVHVQSTWFPLYDRNPQTYVENIFFARPSDYRKAVQRIYVTGRTASAIELPVVPLDPQSPGTNAARD